MRSRSALVVSILTLVLAVPPAGAVDFLVTSTLDQPDVNPGDGICDADAGTSTVCTLRAAILEANALSNDPLANPPYDRILVSGGTYVLTIAGAGEDAAATGDLDLTETALIAGDPANRPVIDGGDLDRVFDFHASAPDTAYVLLDLIVQNGSVAGTGIPGSGGGLRTYGPTLGLARCIVRDNFAEGFGGGIYSEGGDLQVVGSLVEGNSVPTDEFSGASGSGGGIAIRFANLGVGDTTIRGNEATVGGGIDTTSVSGALTFINQSSIVDNFGVWGAGLNVGMPTWLVNSVVANNEGVAGGAGLRTFDAVTISSSTIVNNFSTSTSYAAGIYLQGSSPSVVFDHTILAGNVNGNGSADCDGTLESEGYNLIGNTFGCTITGSTVGNLTNVDPMLVGPKYSPLSSGTAGGRPAWVPVGGSPVIDAGNPSGSTVDHDADPGTAEISLTEDQWNDDRPWDGDGDGMAYPDIGAIEYRAFFSDGFESGDVCAWSSNVGGGSCP